MTARLRLAKYDTSGHPVLDDEVLDQAELTADRRGYTIHEPVPIDPGLVETVARLQGGAA